MTIIKKIFIPPVLVLISVCIIMFIYFLIPEFNLIPYPFNLAGIIVSFSGFILMGKAWELFKKYDTTLDFVQSTKLVTEGVFSKTRNPMYVGMFLLILGIAICFRNMISCLVPFIFILIIRVLFVPFEERLMTEAFGKEYINYKQQVNRWI